MSGRAPGPWLGLARSATLAILIGGLTTCSLPERSGPEQQLGIAFTFDRPTFGIIDVASVRIVVTRVRDAATFATECEIHQDTDGQIVECELVVGLATAVESFELRVTILDQAGNPVYENLGVQTFDVARGDPVVVVNVPLAYVGPGANAAEIRILTTDPRVRPGESATLTAVVLDSSGTVMPGVPIGWVALDPTVTIPNVREGVVVGGAAEGVARVVAYLPTVPVSATPPAGHADTIMVTVEGAREVKFAAASQTVSEGVGTATIAVQLSSPATQAVTVPYTVGGTATSGADYTITASPLTIAAGSTTGTITVTVVNDAIAEPDETVVVTLGTPTNATLGTPATHTLTVADNDVTLTVAVVGLGSVVSQGVSPSVNCSYVNAPCTVTYPLGTSVTLVATSSNPDFQWEYWTGTGSGFTCTTNSTCVVAMNQSRTVTARFSAPGIISLSPTTASFTMFQGGPPTPASQTITVSNVGERPVSLSPIQISYSQEVVPWLSAQISSMVIDTLSPATLTLSVLSNSLAAGVYNATVVVGDFVLTTGQVNVTLTVNPHAPVLSGISYVQLGAINTCDTPYGLGTSFTVSWSYSDAGGDVRSGATTLMDFLFSNGSSGSTTASTRIGGDGYAGTMQSDVCVRFGTATWVDDSIRVTDLAGYQSQPITVRILKPAGAN